MAMTNPSATGMWLAGDGLPESRWSFLATGILIGVLLGTAVTVVAEGRLPALAAPPAAAAASVEFPQRALPPEWRGARPDLDLRHMFPAAVRSRGVR